MRYAAVLVVLGLAAVAVAQDGSTITRVVEVRDGPDGPPAADVVVEAWGLPGGTRTIRTGADGTARFESVPRRGVVFVARRPGSACAWHEPGQWAWVVPEEDRDPDGDGVTRIPLVLGKDGTAVEGRVLTPEGEPVGGAVVRAFVRPAGADLPVLRIAPLWTATADAEGRFRTTEHWPRRAAEPVRSLEAVVVATAPARIRDERRIRARDAGRQKPLELRLAPAAEIRGTVVRSGGSPAAGAAVRAYRTEGGSREFTDTRADESGAFSFSEIRPGTVYRVFAEVGKTDERSALSPPTLLAAAGETAVVELRTRRLGRLALRLLGENGAPPPAAARVRFEPPKDARPWCHDREDDGIFFVPAADAGEWTVTVDAPGYRRQNVPVALGEGEEREVEIRLDRGATVGGLVVDDGGKPVAGATIYVYPVDAEGRLDPDAGYEQAVAGPDGRFRIPGLPPGLVDVSAGHARLRADGSKRVEAPAEDVRLVLHAPGSIRFRLAVPEGAARPGRVRATVTLLSGSMRGAQLPYDLSPLPDGRYAIDGLLPGEVSLGVEAAGWAPYVARLRIPPGGVATPEPFALEEGLTLRGRVVDGEGRPVAGARVMAWGNEANAATTGGDGAFAIPHLAAGAVDLSARAEGKAEALFVATAAADASPLEIVLTPGGIVRGTIRDADGGDPPISLDFFPAAAADDHVSRWRAGAVDGAFSIRLPPGRYRCVHPRAGGAAGPTEFEVEEGGEVVLELASR